MRKAGIIGGSGYIGSHVTRKFLQEGYDVKVCSTDIDYKGEYEHFLNLPESGNLEIHPLDIEDKESVKQFTEDCELLIHGGTPFRLEVEDPEAATKKTEQGEKYLLSGESFKISDIHRIMNDQKPQNKSVLRYSGKKAEQERGLTFKRVHIPLANFSA